MWWQKIEKEAEAENKLAFSTNKPFFVLNLGPTYIVAFTKHSHTLPTRASNLFYTRPHTSHSTHSMCIFISQSLCIQRVNLPDWRTELQLVWAQEFTTFYNTWAAAVSASVLNTSKLLGRKDGSVSRSILSLFKAHSPSVLCTFLGATHEKSLNNEFQGGACSTRQAGFDFTWTTDIGVELLHSPSAPCFFAVFHGNHTLLLLPRTHRKTEDHIFPSFPSHLGSGCWSRSGESSNKRMRAVSRQRCLITGKITAYEGRGREEENEMPVSTVAQKKWQNIPAWLAGRETSISKIKKRSRRLCFRWQMHSQT